MPPIEPTSKETPAKTASVEAQPAKGAAPESATPAAGAGPGTGLGTGPGAGSGTGSGSGANAAQNAGPNGVGPNGEQRKRQKQPRMIWPDAHLNRRPNVTAKPEALKPAVAGPAVAGPAGVGGIAPVSAASGLGASGSGKPAVPASVQQPPVLQPPVLQPPVQQVAVQQTPVQQAPVQQAPGQQVAVQQAAKPAAMGQAAPAPGGPAQARPDQAKPDQARPDQAKPDQAKPAAAAQTANPPAANTQPAPAAPAPRPAPPANPGPNTPAQGNQAQGNPAPNAQAPNAPGPNAPGPNAPAPNAPAQGKPVGPPPNGGQNPGPNGGQNPGPNGGQNPGPNGGQNPAPGGPAKPAAAPAAKPAAAQAEVDEIRPVVGPAKIKQRHSFALLSFVVTVLLPSLVAMIYLYGVAVDQYSSKVGFSVRNEETSAASSLLGGLSSITGGSTSQDSDALYEFIQSQQMVERIDANLDLRAMFSKPQDDLYFAFPSDGSLEKLVDYWQRVVSIAYDGGTGLIQIEVNAFDAHDAQAVTTAIYDESSRMIHELSARAREDATRYAREDLATAEERLKAARTAINAYRSRTQIVDPTASVQSQMGILNQLQNQMAEALIQLDLLRATTRGDDPRISDAELKISVIDKRIAEERQKFGLGGQGIGSDDFSTVVAEFEKLNVDRDFAERSYLAALTALDAAKAVAQRQSRYLAVFISPTLAETPEYPRRALLSALTFMFLSLGWSIIALIYYSVRDRR